MLLVENALMGLSVGTRMLRTARFKASGDYSRTCDAQVQDGMIPRVHLRRHQARHVSSPLAEVLELVGWSSVQFAHATDDAIGSLRLAAATESKSHRLSHRELRYGIVAILPQLIFPNIQAILGCPY